jgi:hypothetical protein
VHGDLELAGDIGVGAADRGCLQAGRACLCIEDQRAGSRHAWPCWANRAPWPGKRRWLAPPQAHGRKRGSSLALREWRASSAASPLTAFHSLREVWLTPNPLAFRPHPLTHSPTHSPSARCFRPTATSRPETTGRSSNSSQVWLTRHPSLASPQQTCLQACARPAAKATCPGLGPGMSTSHANIDSSPQFYFLDFNHSCPRLPNLPLAGSEMSGNSPMAGRAEEEKRRRLCRKWEERSRHRGRDRGVPTMAPRTRRAWVVGAMESRGAGESRGESGRVWEAVP